MGGWVGQGSQGRLWVVVLGVVAGFIFAGGRPQVCCCCRALWVAIVCLLHLLCLLCLLQGLDDAFVSQTPIMEQYAEDLYDPSDPTDREQIQWRQGGASEAAPAEQAAAEQAAQPQQELQLQQQSEGQEADASAAAAAASPAPSGGGTPGGGAGEAAAAGYAHSATSDATMGHLGAEPGASASGRQLSVAAQLQKDAFLVFRALCKLSIRSTESAPGSEITTIRGKVLALELLKILLENSGPLFLSTERFVSAIKQYLCLSLLKNCQSAVPASLRLCCSIFLTLMTKFRHNLKAEIGVFFPMILLRPIEPPVSGATPNAAGAPLRHWGKAVPAV